MLTFLSDVEERLANPFAGIFLVPSSDITPVIFMINDVRSPNGNNLCISCFTKMRYVDRTICEIRREFLSSRDTMKPN